MRCFGLERRQGETLKEIVVRILIVLSLAGALAGCGAMAGSTNSPGGNMHSSQGGMHGGMQGGMSGRGGMMGGMAKHMRAMDSNRDGMISKEEFMKAHEAMFDSMKKNERGHVAMDDMAGMCPMMQSR